MLTPLTAISLGLSLFLTFQLLWLGTTVLSAGNRRRMLTLLAGFGLLLGAAFFLSHGMIVGRGPETPGSGMQFWWQLGWAPAIGAPLVWYAIILRYAGLDDQRRRRLYLPLLYGLSALGGVVLVMLFVANPFRDYETIRATAQPITRTPLVIHLYIIHAVLSFTLALPAMIAGTGEGLPALLRGARPWLLGAGILLQIASIMVAGLASWVVHSALPVLDQQPETMALLFGGDIIVLAFITGSVVLLGRAIVSHEVFTERPLPRQGALWRWYGVQFASAATAMLIALAYARQSNPVYSLTILGLLFVGTLALFSWQNLIVQERFIDGLLPFVRSMHRADDGTGHTLDFRVEARELLAALCEAIDAPGARLSFATASQDAITVGAMPAADTSLDEVALASGRTPGTDLRLALAPRRSRPYSREEMALARACGERVQDALASDEMSRVLRELLKNRLTEFRLYTSQQKRSIHDEVLPALHLALLQVRAGDHGAETAATLTEAHQSLSTLLRNTPHTPGQDLRDHGLRAALARAIERDFAGEFATVRWMWPTACDQRLRDLPDLSADVLFFAALEGVRNAARYARPATGQRPTLSLALAHDPATDDLQLTVADDGATVVQPDGTGSGEGLLLHAAMLAVVGGALHFDPGTGLGARLHLRIPAPQPLPTSL